MTGALSQPRTSLVIGAMADSLFNKAWWSIRTLSIHGDIATAHVEDEWAGMRFDTILTMLLHEGAWHVVSKVYRIQS